MPGNQIILTYKGPIEFKTTEVLLQKVKGDLEGLDIKKVLKKRVYNIMVECIENILRHKAVDPKSDIHPAVILEKKDDCFLIITENVISNNEIKILEQRLVEVSSKNKEELRGMYDRQINKEDILEQTGAGLGIITIALKSDNKMQYSFRPVNKEISIFKLQVTIPVY